jgi:hypothetical protein
MSNLTYGISIYVEDTNKTYHTLDDWGFALGNNNYISDPEMETNYIDVPYRNGLIDASTALTGRPVYKKRKLSFNLGGERPRLSWDAVISRLRNNIHGRTCQLTLDNDPNYYWRGRVYLQDFDRFRGLGTFTLNVPNAEPYKYNKYSSTDPWLWNPFNFETDTITQQGAWTISGTGSHSVPAGHMPTCPTFIVSDLVGQSITMENNGNTYTLTTGSNKFPEVMVNGDTIETFDFTGTAKVQIVYRGGSL